MARGRRPTTDSGTALMHAVLVVSFVILLLTGVRIASDDPAATWLSIFDVVLPMENVWFRHLTSALVFTATLAGYAVYVVRARLTARVALSLARIKALLIPGKARWAACNALIYWGLMLCLMVEIITGILLFLDHGGASLAIHLWTAGLTVVLVGLHVVTHAAIGGRWQVLRILRPAPLVVAPPPPDLAELLAEQLRLRAETAATPAESPSVLAEGSRSPLQPPALALAAMLAGLCVGPVSAGDGAAASAHIHLAALLPPLPDRLCSV